MPAPKGNKYALGNFGGRPRKFKSVKELQSKINAYFKECDSTIVNHTSSGVPITKPATIEGLAIVLECCIDTVRNYEKIEGYQEFFSTIKKAKARIADKKVTGYMSGHYTASFAKLDLINNHGYKDKKIEVTEDENGKQQSTNQPMIIVEQYKEPENKD